MLIAHRNGMMVGGGAVAEPQLTFVINGSSFTSHPQSLGLSTDDDSPIVLDWGDGTKTTVASGTSLGNHTYLSNGTWTAKVYSDGILNRIGTRCFSGVASLTSISIPPTVVYIGGGCLRETGLTSFVFQRQFVYGGDWVLWGCDNIQYLKFDGVFFPQLLSSYLYPNLVSIEFGKDVGDNDIANQNAPIIQGSACGLCQNVLVDPRNIYYEVRGASTGLPQIVRKSDDCLIFAAFGLVGGLEWDGSFVDSSVKAFTNNLARSLRCSKFTVQNGIVNVGSGFCRDNPNLTEVDISSTVANIGTWPLYGSPNVSKITCRAATPPVVTGSIGNYNTNAVVHVPAGSLSAYQSAIFWNAFTTIVDDL